MNTSQLILALMSPPVGGVLFRWLILFRLALWLEKASRKWEPNAPKAGHFGENIHNEGETQS